MKDINWDEYRREDQSINLAAVWINEHSHIPFGQDAFAIEFLQKVEEYQVIKSRQVAALCLTTAELLIGSKLKGVS